MSSKLVKPWAIRNTLTVLPAGTAFAERASIERVMTILRRLFAVACVLILAACQHVPTKQEPVQQGNSAQPSVSAEREDSPASAAEYLSQQQTQQQTQQQPRQQPRQLGRSAPSTIALYLAQLKQEPTLARVDVGGSAPLYALPQPVLTQADMTQASAIDTDKGHFVLLEMNKQGTAMLAKLTQELKGRYLLFSVRGQMLGVIEIVEPITNGRFWLPTNSSEHGVAIIKLIEGKS